MAERDLTTRFGADTSGFSKGVSEVVAQLDKYNKALVDNQQQVKKVNKEISDLEKQQNKLKKQMEDGGTEEQKKQYAELTEKIEQHRVTLAQLRTDQARIKNAISETSSELKKEGQEVEKTSDGFTVMKGAISNLVSDALNVAIDKFKEMSTAAEKSLNNLQVKTGMSTEAVGALKDKMYDIYKNNFGDSLTDVADKMALVTQNINESDPEKIKEITQNAIGLSDAFGSDFEENLRGVNGLMTNMGLTADEAFDLIAKGSQNGLDKTHELADNIAEYSQIWGQAGFTAQEMFSVLQNGIDSGAYNLDKVNDLVKEISISIIDGKISKNIESFSEKTQQLFESFENGGATQREVFDSIINDLSHTTNLAEQLATASTNWSALGEDNAMSVITALNNVNDTYKDVSGTMQEINDIQYEDIGSQVQALGRQFEVDILQPVVEKATPKIKEFITWLSDHLPEVTSALAGLITSVVTFKTATAAGNFLKTMIDGFKSLKPVIESATEAQLANNAAVKANFYVAIASAILSAIAAITTWIVTANNATSATTSNTQSIKNYTQAMQEAVSSVEDSEAQATSEIALIKSKEERYDELRKKVNLTVQEKSELNNLGADLAKTIGTTTDKLKDESGAWKDASSSIEEYTKQLKNKLILESSEEALKEAYKVTEFDVTQEDVDAAFKAYDDYGEKLWQQIKESSKYHDFAREGRIFDKSSALNNKELVEVVGGDWNELNSLKSVWSDLLVQRDQALGVIEKYTKIANDARKSINEEGEALGGTTEKTKKAILANEELTQTMSEMSAKTTAVTKAEKEYKETGTLTASTLQAVIDKYPNLQNEVDKYMLGLTDAKSLIKSMKNVYKDDLNAYIGVVAQKASNSNTFYNQLINANANFVNKAKEQYGVDLLNFKNLQEAKAAMVANTVSKVQGPTQMGTVDFSKSVLGYGQVNESSWQYKVASNIVDSFIGSAISATTNYTDFFSTPSGKSSGTGSKSGSTSTSSKKDNKYDLASEAYNRLIDKRIEKINKEAEAAEKAKDKKIAAINAEIEARKRLNEDSDLQNELNEVNAQLQYSQLDSLSRRELERRRQDLLNEQSDIYWERMMSDKKDKIESDYSKQSQSYDKATKALQEAAESAKNYFSRLAGTQTNSQIVNNNSDTRNIQIIANALSNQQMLDKLLNAIYSK